MKKNNKVERKELGQKIKYEEKPMMLLKYTTEKTSKFVNFSFNLWPESH